MTYGDHGYVPVLRMLARIGVTGQQDSFVSI